MNEIKTILKRPGTSRDGWCERHGHHCVPLEVNRAAARNMGALTLVTMEEKAFLSNAGGSLNDKNDTKG